ISDFGMRSEFAEKWGNTDLAGRLAGIKIWNKFFCRKINMHKGSRNNRGRKDGCNLIPNRYQDETNSLVF
ncbi:MAG: hypothetical protein WCO56_28415, partial [Verrucomicrobiota bacterium]